MKPQRAATVLLHRPDGKILMQLRDDGGGKEIPFPNAWNFPGGLVEDGETPLEAAVREIKEEYDLEIDPTACRQIWAYSHAHADEDYIFLCNVAIDVAPVLHEGAAFAWMTPAEIGEVSLGFDQGKVLPHIPSDEH